MKSHYDTLELKKNCTAEDIKNSYIKLSKKYHPDKNKNKDAHNKFVQVNEAYSVLGKTHSRFLYDQSLLSAANIHKHMQGHRSPGMATQNMTYYDYYTMNRMRENSEYNNAYVRGSKMTAVFICCCIMAIGAAIHLKYAWMDKEERYLRSHRAALLLALSGQRAQIQGKEQSIRDFENGSFRGISDQDVAENFNKDKK